MSSFVPAGSSPRRENENLLVLCLRAILRKGAVRYAGQLVESLSGIVDLRLRAMRLGKHLQTLPPVVIADILSAIMEAANRRKPGFPEILQSMLYREMREHWSAELDRQVQSAARERGYFDLAGILLDLPPGDDRVEGDIRRTPKDLADIPLGVRKSWARKQDIFLLERLLCDPDQAVVDNLLDNPRMTTYEVLKLAARTPIAEGILEAVARHPRWNSRYRIRRALAHNPSTPTRIALGLLYFLTTPDLEGLVQDSRLSRVLVGRAENVISTRKKSPH